MDEQIRSGDQLHAGSSPRLPETADANSFDLPERAPLLLTSAADRPPPPFWPLFVLSLFGFVIALSVLFTFPLALFYRNLQPAPFGSPPFKALSDQITELLLWVLIPMALTNLAWIIAIGYYRIRYFSRPPGEAIRAVDRDRLNMQRGHR